MSSYPMRQKYLDEALGRLFVFGVDVHGNVDISNGQTDVLTAVPPDSARRICDAHAEFMKVVYEELAL